jgi:thiol-disulfide isomerase/thioredoxin
MVVWCSLTGVIVASGCTSRPQEQTKRTFPMITVPVIYADPTARAEYLAMHYWDRFDFNDTAYVGSAALVSEQAIVDYITVLRYASYPVICDGLKHLMDKAEKYPAMYAYFSSQMEHYLFDAGSSLRNDEFYIPVLEHIVASDSLNEPRKIRPNLLLAQLRKNRPGTQAANIHYATASGIKASLHDLKSEYILVMFHNLNCGNCKELTAQIEASPVTGEMQKRKKLTILAVYPGQEVEAWRKHLAEMPSSWVNGYDYGMEIENQETYVLRIIPTLYLLDKNHRVIIKDAAFNYVEYYLNSILNLPATRDAKLPSK